jgi:hypothetical protein
LYPLFIFATLDTNAGEAEGEYFGEGDEEDQGLASRGKPFTLISCYYLLVVSSTFLGTLLPWVPWVLF